MKHVVDMYTAQLKTGPNTKGVGNQPLAPKVLADGTKEFHLTAEARRLGGRAGQDRARVDVQRHRARAVDQGRTSATRCVSSSTTSCRCRRACTSTASRCRSTWTACPTSRSSRSSPAESFTYEFTANKPELGMYHSHHDAQVQVPNGMLGIFQIGDPALPPQHRPGDAGRADGAERRRRDRLVAERQVVPGDRAGHRARRRLGGDQLLQRGSPDPPDAPARVAAARDRRGRLSAAAAVHGRHARRSRPGSGSRRSCTSRRTSSARTTRPASGRSTATSSRTPKARTACSAW